MKWVRLGWYWLRSRYAAPNAFVRCHTCPYWLLHSDVDWSLPDAKLTLPLALRFRAGLCLKDRPRIFNDYTTGYALKVWTGNDWCSRHPLYYRTIVQGSDLEYRPGEETLGAAGFNRLPTFAEAVKIALAKPDTINVPDRVSGKVSDTD